MRSMKSTRTAARRARVSRNNTRSASAVAALALLGLAACGVSRQQEVEIGSEVSREVDSQLPIVLDAEINRYLAVLGDSIARIADTRDLEWQFKVVNSPDINAFALPGGFVYVNRGLIERAENLSQVAGVMGHEIGHVTGRHAIEQMQKMQGANVGLLGLCFFVPAFCTHPMAGLGVNIGAGAVFSAFSRAAETEADSVAVAYLVRAGIDPRGVPQMFRILLEERTRKATSVDAWFATHPLEEKRIAETEALIATYDSTMIRTLTSDSPRFQEFKRRVSALGPGRVTGR
jgi:predicted Zn-dependent protease